MSVVIEPWSEFWALLEPCGCGTGSCEDLDCDGDCDALGVLQSGGKVQILCPVCGAEGPWAESADEALELWNAKEKNA